MNSGGHRLAVVALAIAGIGLAVFAGHRQWVDDGTRVSLVQWILPFALAGLALIPQISQWINKQLARQANASPRQQIINALALAVGAMLWFLLASAMQGRNLVPKIHDEFCYLIQAHILAQGKLWMPGHPLGLVFESFYLVTQPVYTAIYFPGTAMLQVPGVWLGLPTFIMPLLISGACVGLMYLVIARLTDPALGLIAAIMLMCGQTMDGMAPQILSVQPILLATLGMIWAWLRWRSKPNLARAAIFGLIAGWAAITRPSDAAVFGLPIVLAVLPAMHKIGWRKAAGQLAMILLCAVPFLSLQIALDKKITGSALVTPHEYTTIGQFPGVAFGWDRTGPLEPPSSPLPQRRIMYERFYKPILQESMQYNRLAEIAMLRLPRALAAGLPVVLLAALLPLGLLQIGRNSRWILPVALVLFFAIYMFYPAFLKHYALVVAPAFILLVALAGPVLAAAFPSAGSRMNACIVAFILGCCLATMIVIARKDDSNFRAANVLAMANEQIADHVHAPAIVLFTFDQRADVNDEPVYNADVAWPDDAPVIRCHDLGDQFNRKIFEYYAHHGPDRAVWRFSRTDGSLKYVGTARKLAGGASESVR